MKYITQLKFLIYICTLRIRFLSFLPQQKQLFRNLSCKYFKTKNSNQFYVWIYPWYGQVIFSLFYPGSGGGGGQVSPGRDGISLFISIGVLHPHRPNVDKTNPDFGRNILAAWNVFLISEMSAKRAPARFQFLPTSSLGKSAPSTVF